MARLIDADELKTAMDECIYSDRDRFSTGYAKSFIDNAPTVDAVPVVHGKWIPFEGETGVEAFGYKEYATLGFGCSVCHADIDVSEQYFRYCPMCGAKMSNGERKGGDE